MIRTRLRAGRRTKPAGRGALFVLSLFLVGSAVMRLGDDAGKAMARAVETAPDAAGQPEVAAAACRTPEDFQPLLEALNSREASLEDREAAFENRMRALEIADREVTRKLEELQQAEDALRQTIALADTAAEDDIDRLTRVYENMKPQQASALFEEMDPNFAAGFLSRMRPEVAAAIMAGLTPNAAHTFSVVIAGRNANVPTE